MGAGSQVGGGVELGQWARFLQFVDADDGGGVVVLVHGVEGQRHQVLAEQRQVGAQPCGALVHVGEGLQVGDVDEQEQALFVGVGDGDRLLGDGAKLAFKAGAIFKRNVDGAAHAHAVVSNRAAVFVGH